jgi:hypothetical protein
MLYYVVNDQNQNLRTIATKDAKVFVALNRHTHRLDFLSSNDLATTADDSFEILQTINTEQRDCVSFNIFSQSFQLRQACGDTPRSLPLPADNADIFQRTLQKTALVSLAIAAVSLVSTLIWRKMKPPAEPAQIIEIMDRAALEKILSPSAAAPKIVVPSNARVTTQKRKPSPRTAAQPHVNRESKRTLKQLGALRALGELQKSHQVGGLKLNKAGASRGVGLGGTNGSGGAQTSLYGRGIIVSPLGSGKNLGGGGGYGSKGRGGGQAGYGRISLVGQDGTFFQALTADALVDGGLSRDEIAAVIQRHLNEVRYCYEQGLLKNPSLKGRLGLQFIIGTDGRVTTAKTATSSLGSTNVESCIRGRLMSWQFPEPRGGVNVRVSYPFVLKRAGST